MTEKYVLNTLEKNKYEPFRNLDESEYLKLKESINLVNEYSQQLLSYIFFQLNLIELDKRIKPLKNISVSNFNIKAINDSRLIFEINRTVLNLLFSFKYYIDSTKCKLSRKYGADSVELSNFILKTNQAFDDSFAYRFLTKLRDYAQHVGFPIHMIPFNAVENIKEPHNMKGSFKLVVSHELLLKEDIGRIVKNDLKQIRMDIDIIPLVYELGKIIGNFESYLLELNQPEIGNAIELIENYSGNRKTAENSIVVMYNVKIEEPYYSFDTLTLPFDHISEIKNFISWKDKTGANSR